MGTTLLMRTIRGEEAMSRFITIKQDRYWWQIIDVSTGHLYGPGLMGFDRKRDARKITSMWNGMPSDFDPPSDLRRGRSA